MAILLKGAPVAKEICEEAARRAEKLRERGIAPALAIVRVGENDADIYYERAAMRRCDAAGIDVRNVILRESVTRTARCTECSSSVPCLLIYPTRR